MEPVNTRSPEPPSAARTAPSWLRSRAAEWVGYVLALVALVALMAIDVRRDQARYRQFERQQLENDVAVVNTLLLDKLRAMDQAIEGVRSQRFWRAGTQMPATQVSERLGALVAAMDGVRSILIVDRAGTGVASNRPELVGLDYTDRECFRALRARPDPEALCVSRPFVTALGLYTVVITKMLASPAGGFDGTVSCILDPAWFTRLLRPLQQRSPDLRLSVAHRDGGVISTEPASGPWGGGDTPVPPPWLQRLREATGAGAFQGADLDGRERLVAYAPLDATGAKPLATLASRDLLALQAPVRKAAYEHAVAALLVAAIGALALLLLQQRRRVEAEGAARLEAERQAHAERVRANLAELVEQQVAVQTASAFAHDLNQPLLAISAYSEAALNALARGDLDHAKLRRMLEGSFQQAQRAGALMHDLSAHLSQALHVHPTPDTFDLNQLVRDCVADTVSQREGRAAPGLRLYEALPLVAGSRVRAGRVICNLLANAYEANLAVGSRAGVTLSTFREGGEAVVSVADAGAGVAPEDAERIFSPFYSTKASGLGLGLSISRALAESQGGRLTLVSREGPGAEFHFTIPLASSHADHLSR